jgi:hypothetical protein
MLTNAQRASLLAAVPSFVPRWMAWQQDQLDYTSRFPEETLSDRDVGYNFLSELAEHIAERFATATTEGELAAMFAALEEIFAAADAELWTNLSLFLLEELITDFQHKGQDAARLQEYIHGPLTTRAWHAAWDYMHPSPPPSA